MYQRRSNTHDGPLTRLVYRSRCVPPDAPASPTVTDILDVARRNNMVTGVTGVLLFDGTTFVQAIEGERGEVEDLYESIARDTRHEEIELIGYRPIAARGYRPDPMGYVDGTDADAATLRGLLSP